MTSPFARRFKSYYGGEMACGHLVEEGDIIAFTPDDELVCSSCADAAEQDNGVNELYEWIHEIGSE